MSKPKKKFIRAHEGTHPLLQNEDTLSLKLEKIEQIIDELECSDDEADELIRVFSDIRTRKITSAKMASKLKHMRFETKRRRVESALDSRFDIGDRLLFYAPLSYNIFGKKFTKIHELKSKPFTYSYLHDSDEKSLISELKEIKNSIIKETEESLGLFLSSIELDNPYLSKEQILTILKSAPVESDLLLPPIDKDLLLNILRKIGSIDSLYIDNGEVICSTEQRYTPDGFSRSIVYEAHTTKEHKELLQNIYLGLHIELQTDSSNAQESFNAQLQELRKECADRSKALLSKEQIDNWLENEITTYHYSDLYIDTKSYRRVLFHFDRFMLDIRVKEQRQKLLARTIRDFKNLFPQARSMHREIIFYTGQTNSGKTYRALKELKEADTGYYLAPLRLLALEGYEDLCSSNISASLITGEEQIIDDDATHISSTIEMLDFATDVDVCVIDEVQMIDDRERGWAWANAIIGAPASKIILTGSISALEAIQRLALYLNEPLKVVELERKNPLKLLNTHTPLNKIEPKTALIAFSRKDVLSLKQQLSKKHSVSVVYGNLSPEVRREEARRFRSGETEVLIATDAIAMGLNLPIKTILFSKLIKYDGQSDKPLTPSQVHQISGRAGRYGLSESGYVGTLKADTLKMLHSIYKKKIPTINMPFKVMASLDHIEKISQILEESSLTKILDFFVQNMRFDGPFRATNIDSMLEAAQIVDRYELDLKQKYHLASAPLTLKSAYIVKAYERYIEHISLNRPILYASAPLLSEYAHSMKELLNIEDRVKEITLYLWLSYRFESLFVECEKARQHRSKLNKYIENSLKNSQFIMRCKRCNRPLKPTSKHSICDRCFKQNRRVVQ